ncbi:MCP four helix bundle domain-containing protein [Massilia violaceinigra]|uniref:MCP four helix bundle domain-containing protein n=1 Tax=Massilia violaceinigra TaxID=2045208 RepID=A0ABY4AAB1_9BURK|nr:methyl-accepting chemotaxis protein [Massilia violaceinigra]UOD31744.1 MCP four helix bundle domain-containing protein [Massilia violaceinigra]
MFKNVTIKARLIFVIGVISAISLVIGIIGLRNLSVTNASLKTVYEDRLVAAGMLAEVLTQIQQNQNTLAMAVSGDPARLPEASSDVEQRVQSITALWGKYMETYLTPEEKALAAKFAASRETFVAQGIKPTLAAFKAKDVPAAVALVHGALHQSFIPVRDNMRTLINYQLTVGKSEYQQAMARFDTARALAIGLIVLSIAVGLVMGAALIRGISRSIAEALRFANSIAGGNLTDTIKIESNDEIGQLLVALQKMNDSLVEVVRRVRSGTETISVASSEIAAGNQDLSSRTEEQASSLEETASSMEELTSTVRASADNARQASTLAATASDVATKGGNVIGNVVDTMGRINEASNKIVDIIGVIDGIAFQTNILALNAAVEAARAGEQGRGFAVVASEVRNLAQRSAQAAKEIKGLIGSSVEQVEAGSKLVNEAGSTMNDIVQSIQRVTDIMGDIAAASQEQTLGIDQINQAVTQMDQVTQQNAALVEEAAAASEAMQDQARQLAEVVSVFKLSAAVAGAAAPRMVAARPAPKAAVRAPVKKQLASTAPTEDWEEF